MAKEETIGFVGLSLDDLASLDGPACHICGMIMVRKEELWACTSCGATTGCTEVKDGEK